MAVSIACVRAAARHKSLEPYQFIMDLMGGSTRGVVKIPLPVVSILSRLTSDKTSTQNLSLYHTDNALNFETTMCKLLCVNRCIKTSETVKNPAMVSSCGAVCVEEATLDDAFKLVRASLREAGLAREFSFGLDFAASSLLSNAGVATEPRTEFLYIVDESAAAPVVEEKGKKGKAAAAAPVPAAGGGSLSGADVSGKICKLWAEQEFISLDDPLHSNDSDALAVLKRQISATYSDQEDSNSGKLANCKDGIGGDSVCKLQVVLDGAKLLQVKEDALEAFLTTFPYNAVKVQLCTLATVSAAISICKRAKAVNIAVQVASADRNLYPEPSDAFIADFAVGVGAGQLVAGGLESGEYYSKYNRITDIILENGENIQYHGRNFR